jgi:prolyl-tRNA synthetase
VQSYRDLPLLLNQWANVVRWELRPRVFLRTTEFLWQEGHCAHATEEDAQVYARRILHEVYEDFMVNELAIPVIPGRKSPSERFAGATNTLTVEAMMVDGKALQMGTSHELGQNFAKAFGIQYLDASSTQQHCWTTSWGVSTRMMGGLIMAHGDDRGLRVPPRIAATQAVVMVVRDDDGSVTEAGRGVLDALRAAGVRVTLDDAVSVGFGRRATDWELKGVPIRVEVGPRDLAEGLAVIVRRDTSEKVTVPIAELAARVPALLDEIQASMLAAATEARDTRITRVDTIADAVEAAATGFALIPWDRVGAEGEAELGKSAISVRCLVNEDGSVATEDAAPGTLAYVARSY